MTQFTPGAEAALQTDTPIIVGLLKIELPDATITVIDGASEIQFASETYVGRDPVFGVLAAVDDISDGVGDEAPAMRFTFHPASDAAAAELAGATMQGSPVQLWLAVVDRATGAIIPDPLPIFFGALDQPTLSLDRGTRELEYDCVSHMERLFENQEGVRLADSWHQQIWPSEKGLFNVSALTKTIYWGVHAPAGVIAAAPSRFSPEIRGAFQGLFSI